MFWKRFLKIKSSVFSLFVLILILLMAIFAPCLTPYDPLQQSILSRRLPPNKVHFFGTDIYGRDIFSRVLYGARSTIVAALFSVVICIFFGTILGVLSGYYHGGILDIIVMRIVDILLSFPYFLLAILIVAILGYGLYQAAIAVAISTLPKVIRVIRGAVISIVNSDYIESTRSLGSNDFRIIYYHLIPNISSTIIVYFTLQLSQVILSISSLSFLGLGAQPPMPEWGAMLNEGKGYLLISPHMSIIPGIFILLLVLSANILGDGLRDVLDPRLKY